MKAGETVLEILYWAGQGIEAIAVIVVCYFVVSVVLGLIWPEHRG